MSDTWYRDPVTLPPYVYVDSNGIEWRVDTPWYRDPVTLPPYVYVDSNGTEWHADTLVTAVSSEAYNEFVAWLEGESVRAYRWAWGELTRIDPSVFTGVWNEWTHGEGNDND